LGGELAAETRKYSRADLDRARRRCPLGKSSEPTLPSVGRPHGIAHLFPAGAVAVEMAVGEFDTRRGCALRKDLQVLGHCGPRHRQASRQLSDRKGLLGEQLEDGQPSWLGQDAERRPFVSPHEP
jgi:hypothetical protein